MWCVSEHVKQSHLYCENFRRTQFRPRAHSCPNILLLIQSVNIIDVNSGILQRVFFFLPLSCHQYSTHSCLWEAAITLCLPPPPPRTSISRVEKCDFLNLTFLHPALPECSTVMRYSVETSNRLMVHLAGLINSYVEVEKASRRLFPHLQDPR